MAEVRERWAVYIPIPVSHEVRTGPRGHEVSVIASATGKTPEVKENSQNKKCRN